MALFSKLSVKIESMSRKISLKELLDFVKVSLHLDTMLLQDAILKLSYRQKIEFIFKKYLFLLNFFILRKNFIQSQNYIHFWSRKFFSADRYGLAGYHTMLTRTLRELLCLKVRDHQIKVIFDVGANEGSFALTCVRLFKPEIIYCFEPVPLTFECLEKNTKDFPEIKPIKMGLSNFTGESGMVFDQEFPALSKLSSEENNIQVKLTSLQEFVTQNNISQIDLLKIDVESSENLVLEGCGDFLSKVKYIYMEITIRDNPNYTISSLLSLLYGKGYNFQLVHYRNASNKSHGPIHFMDFLLENVEFEPQQGNSQT